MARSKQTSMKKDRENKKRNKKRKKEEKREERKANSNKGKGFDSMIAYVDEFGKLSDTPPESSPVKEISIDNEHATPRVSVIRTTRDYSRSGKVVYCNREKGFGFIRERNTAGTVYFKVDVSVSVNVNDTVGYEQVTTIKGPTAVKLRKIE